MGVVPKYGRGVVPEGRFTGRYGGCVRVNSCVPGIYLYIHTYTEQNLLIIERRPLK